MTSIKQIIGTLCKQIKQNGGIMSSLYILFITDDLKDGKHVGTDEFGNRYFENNRYFFGRHRWVIYSPKVGLYYDASQIPAQWFGWLHSSTDVIPTKDKTRPYYSWMEKHTPNLSGTSRQYVPYCTAKPKIYPWVPPH